MRADFYPEALPPAVVLCGGLGTRLRPVVDDRPKVLADVHGVPFLTLVLRHLQRAGVHRVVLSAGYRADQIEAYAQEAAPSGLRIDVVTEPALLGTGGALRLAADTAGLTAPFLALNGDTFCGADLAALVAAHHACPDALATLTLVRVPDAARYGTVRFDAGTRRVETFAEKQPGAAAWINAGVYVLAPAALADVPPGRPVSLERDIFPQLQPRLFAHPQPQAPFLDIGTPDDYERAPSILPSSLFGAS